MPRFKGTTGTSDTLIMAGSYTLCIYHDMICIYVHVINIKYIYIYSFVIYVLFPCISYRYDMSRFSFDRYFKYFLIMSTQCSPKLFQNIPVCFSLSQLRYLCEWLLYSLLVGFLRGKPDETSNLPAISPVSFNVLICTFGRYQVGIPKKSLFSQPNISKQCEVEEYEILGITHPGRLT